MNRRCQIDIIDLQAEPDGQWKYILNYQDHHTKVMRVERDDMCKAVFDQSMSKWLIFSRFFPIVTQNLRIQPHFDMIWSKIATHMSSFSTLITLPPVPCTQAFDDQDSCRGW